MTRASLLATILGLLAAPLTSQTSSVSGPPMEVDAVIAKRLFAAMTTDLRNLVVAQEAYFADNTRYGRLLSRTDASQVLLKPSPGVTVTLTYVTNDTWAGRATHEWLPGRSCVITIGEIPPSRLPHTTGDGLSPTEEGEPVCDSF